MYEKPLERAFEKSLVGRRVKIFWEKDNYWYEGALVRYNKTKNRWRIDYDDGDHEWLDIRPANVMVQKGQAARGR